MKLKERNMKERGGSDRGAPVSAATTAIMVTPGFDHASSLPSGGASDAALAIAASQPIIPPHDSQYGDQAQFEADKRSVYKHPLFPLLALLFEKCELATQTSAESPISDSFHQDLEAFVQHQERDRKPLLANDPEIDGLMIKAIQVLRIHLLELDKVQELCKDFCNRYITCLKGKMQSENLLRSDYYDNGGGHNGSAHISSHSNSPHHSYSSNGEASVSPPNGVFHLQNPGMSTGGLNYPLHSSGSNPTVNHSGQQSSGSSLLGGLPSPEEHSNTNSSNHHHHHSQTSAVAALPLIHGGTPLSQIGANTCPPVSFQDTFVQTPQTPSSGEDEDDFTGRKKPKRGVLPKHATSIMRSWLFQHIVHPYPTEDEKRQIAGQTNLTLLQVNNWFINARRRILQPMLDASNPEAAATPKVKKVKTHSSNSKPALKYWSDNLASISSSGQIEGIEDSNGLDLPDDSSDELDESSNDGNDLLIDNSDSSQP